MTPGPENISPVPNRENMSNSDRRRITIPDQDNHNASEDWIVPISSRREGRERVISLLYEMEIKNSTAKVVMGELTLKPDPFVSERFLGICQNDEKLKNAITNLSQDWDTSRMPLIDYAILRLGMFELMFCTDIPAGVILSEAVELAQKYSTESSGKFINGLLSAAARELRRPD